MSDEGGTWNREEGQRWDAGFTVLQEVDLTKDLNRSEEWSDISDDESPAVYADISHSAAYHYHAVQPKETVWDSSYLSHVSSAALQETPTVSSFPFQDGLFWRQQQPQVAVPGVASGSSEYPAAPYPPAFYPSPFYPPAICQMVEEKTYSSDKGGETEKEKKKKNRNVSFIEQAAEKHKQDCPKNRSHHWSEAEGKESATSSLAIGPTSKVETLETARSGHLSLEEPHSQKPGYSEQKHNYSNTTMLPKSDASMFQGQQCEYNNAMTSREPHGGSAVTICVSSSDFSLDSCPKAETTVSSESLVSEQCDLNRECKTVSASLVTDAKEQQEKTLKDTHRQVLGNSDRHEAESVEICSDEPTVSMQSQSSTQEQSKGCRGPKSKVEPEGSRTQDYTAVQPSTDETLTKEMGISSPSESFPDRSDENRTTEPDQYRGVSMSEILKKGTPKGSGMQDNSDIHTSADKEMGKSSSPESTPLMSDEKNAVVPGLLRGTSKSGKLKKKVTSKGSRVQNNSDVQISANETIAKEMGKPSSPESTPVISNEKNAVVPGLLRGTSKSGKLTKKVRPKRSRVQNNSDVQISANETIAKEMGKPSSPESSPVISNEKNSVVPLLLRGTSKSEMVNRKGTPKRSRLQDNTDAQPSTDDLFGKEMGTSPPESSPPKSTPDEKRTIVPDQHEGKSGRTLLRSKSYYNPNVQPCVSDETLGKAIGVPPPLTISNEKRTVVPDQLKGTSEELGLDKPGQNGTNVSTSKVTKPPSLAPETDDMKNRGSRKLGMGFTGILMKQQKKAGRPFKKKTLLKMAKLLEIAKECVEDTTTDTDANVTTDAHLKLSEKSDTKGLNTPLISSNEKSRPSASSFSHNVKEYIYNLSISPLSKNPVSLKGVPATQCEAKSKKKVLRKQQRTQELSISSVLQDPKLVPESRQSASRIEKTHEKSSSVTPQQKPVNQPVLHDASAIKPVSKLRSATSSTKKSSEKKSSYIIENKDDTCEEKSNLSVKDLVFVSQTSEAGMPPQMSTTAKLTKKWRKNMSRKASLRAHLQLSNANPQISSPQKELKSTIATEEKIKNRTEEIQMKGAEEEKVAKGRYVTDIQNESASQCEVVDVNELQVRTDGNTNRQVVSTALVPEVEYASSGKVPVESHVQELTKRGRGPKRKGKAKRKGRIRINPVVLSDETVVPETLPERSAKLLKNAPKESVEKSFEQTASNDEKGENDMGQIDPNGLPVQKDASCDKAEANILQPLGEKKARKRKAKDDGEIGLTQNNCNANQVSNSSEFTINISDHSIPPPKSTRLRSNTEPMLKTDGFRHPRKKEKNAPEASQPVLTENVFQSDSMKLVTQAAQTTLQTPEGSNSKTKVGIPKVEPASQDKAGIIGMAETLPKTRILRKSKTEVEVVPIDTEVQLSTENSSFDFAEEEFLVPVIKVSPRKDVSLEIVTPKQSCSKTSKKNCTRVKGMRRKVATKSKTSQETKEIPCANICSELLEIKPEPLVVPHPVTKPVEKQTCHQRKLKSSLSKSDAQHSDCQIMTEKSSCNTTEDQEGGRSTEIKMEQAEFALSAVDTGLPVVSQSSIQTTDYLAMLKRKPGRPFKKKTLLRMAKILEIVQEAGSGPKENDGITNFVEGILPKKHQSKVKKEKIRPLVSPTRRSLRTFDPGKSESEIHSSSSISVDTDCEGNMDTSSSPSALTKTESVPSKCSTNTLTSDSNQTAVDEVDKQDLQAVTEAESRTVRTLKKRRKRRVLNPKKKKMGWRKLYQQLANVPAAREVSLSSNNEDTVCVSTNKIEISCKVSSLPLSCKVEQLEHAILNKADTSQSDSAEAPLAGLEKRTKLAASTLTQSKRGRRGRLGVEAFLVEDSSVSMELAALTPNQEKEDADLNAEQSVKRRTGRGYKKKTYLKKSKLTAVVQTVSELNKSLPEMKGLDFCENSTKIKTEECAQSVNATQAFKLRRSSRGLSSTSLSTADKGPTQPKQNLKEEMQSSNLGETFLNESKVKVDDCSLGTQSDDVTLSSSDVQEQVPVLGQLKQKKTRKGRKRKLNSKTSGVVRPPKTTDTTSNSDASPTVALNTFECQGAYVELDDVSKKSKIMIDKTVLGKVEEPSGAKMVKCMDKRARKTLFELSGNKPADPSSEKVDTSAYEDHVVKNHTPAKSTKILSSSETPLRRSIRASGSTGATSSPEKDGQNVIESPEKIFQPTKSLSALPTQEQMVSAVSSDMVEATTGCLVSDNEPKPDLQPSTPADDEITEMQASSTPVGKTAEAVKIKRRRKKIKRWGNRRYAKSKHTSTIAQVNKQPVIQSVKATEEKSSFDSEANVEELFSSEPLEDSEEESQPIDGESVITNLSVHSGCQTSLSMSDVSLPPQDVQKVDGCTQYSEEEFREQRVTPFKSPSRLNVRNQTDKKSRTSIKCRFCERSFRHISAYTVHQRLHTGEKPYQCKDCGKRFAQVSKLQSHKKVHKATGAIQCPCCSQQFSKKEQLITHFKVHLPSVDHISPTERKTQVSPSKPSSTLTYSSSGVFNCSVCGKDLPTEQKLRIHKRSHKGECLSCKDCGKTFRKQSSLSAHERVHWPLKPYACSICGKGFSKLHALKTHSLEHTGETPFFCSHCGYACSDLPTLRAHQASKICSIKNQDNIEGFLIQMGVDGQVNTPNLFKCHLCKKLLSHWCQYTLHLQTHTKVRPYLCHTCGQSYDTDSDVRVHCRDCCKSSGEEKACLGSLSDVWTSRETGEISLSQEPDSPEHLDGQPFVSPDNSSVHPDPLGENEDPHNSQLPSPTPSNVSILSSHPSIDCYIVSSIHARTQTLRKRFECQHCGRTFRLFSFLRAHLQTHLPGNKYTCWLCGRVFQRWHKLWLHQRLHQEKGKSFTCSNCNVQFHFLGLYREHLREHAEQRPYACPLCPETFLSEENLYAHQCEKHRTCRTLRCEVCGKGFSSLRNWMKHSLLHNGRSSHRCLLCERSFASNHILQDHLKTHNNDLRFPTSEIPSEPLLFPHQCWYCNASFSSGELLYAHQICHAVGGKPPARPKDAPISHRNTNEVTRTVPPPTVLESSSVPEPSAAKRAPAPEIPEESLFHYAHPDSLYVVPDPTPPPPIPRNTHSFSRSKGPSCSQASNIPSSQQVIFLDDDSLSDAADTNPNAPSTSQTIPNSSLIADVHLPQTRRTSQRNVTKSSSEAILSPVPTGSSARHLRGEPTLSLQIKHTLPSGHEKSGDAAKHFSITVKLQDARGFECADCNVSLSSIKQLHQHYLKHAKGVLTKLHV